MSVAPARAMPIGAPVVSRTSSTLPNTAITTSSPRVFVAGLSRPVLRFSDVQAFFDGRPREHRLAAERLNVLVEVENCRDRHQREPDGKAKLEWPDVEHHALRDPTPRERLCHGVRAPPGEGGEEGERDGRDEGAQGENRADVAAIAQRLQKSGHREVRAPSLRDSEEEEDRSRDEESDRVLAPVVDRSEDVSANDLEDGEAGSPEHDDRGAIADDPVQADSEDPVDTIDCRF